MRPEVRRVNAGRAARWEKRVAILEVRGLGTVGDGVGDEGGSFQELDSCWGE